MLGTTFGGNHLACAAGLAVLEIIEAEQLISHASSLGSLLYESASGNAEYTGNQRQGFDDWPRNSRRSGSGSEKPAA